MKKYLYLIVLATFLLVPELSYAQIKIVGVNTNAPESKINYLETPVQVESFLSSYIPSNPKFSPGDLPNNEQLYLSEYWSLGYRFDTDSTITVGVPEGYYNIAGCYIYKEEIAEIQKKTMKIAKAHNTNYPYGRTQFDSGRSEVERFESYFYGFELTKQQLQEKISLSNNPSIDVPMYILTNSKGEEYYIRPFFFRDAKYVMIDNVLFFENLYKGKNFNFYSFYPVHNYVSDIYSKLKVPITVAEEHERLGYIFFTSLNDVKTYINRITPLTSYHCSDILVDGNKVIAVLDGQDGNKFSVALGEEYNAKYSVGMSDNSDFYLSCRYISGEGGLVFFTKEQVECFIQDYNKIAAKNNVAQSKMEAEQAALEQNRRKELTQRFGNEYTELILKHKLAIGMTKEMCLASIGFPYRRFKSVTEYGETEIYYYAYMAVYFSNGKITRIAEVN